MVVSGLFGAFELFKYIYDAKIDSELDVFVGKIAPDQAIALVKSWALCSSSFFGGAFFETRQPSSEMERSVFEFDKYKFSGLKKILNSKNCLSKLLAAVPDEYWSTSVFIDTEFDLMFFADALEALCLRDDNKPYLPTFLSKLTDEHLAGVVRYASDFNFIAEVLSGHCSKDRANYVAMLIKLEKFRKIVSNKHDLEIDDGKLIAEFKALYLLNDYVPKVGDELAKEDIMLSVRTVGDLAKNLNSEAIDKLNKCFADRVEVKLGF